MDTKLLQNVIESREKTGPIFGTSVSVELVEEKLIEFFGTKSKFGTNLRMVHIGIGQVYKHSILITYFRYFVALKKISKKKCAMKKTERKGSVYNIIQ